MPAASRIELCIPSAPTTCPWCARRPRGAGGAKGPDSALRLEWRGPESNWRHHDFQSWIRVRSAVRPGVARARSPCKSGISRSAACLRLHRPFPPSWTPGGRRASAPGRRAAVPAVRAIAGAGWNRRRPGAIQEPPSRNPLPERFSGHSRTRKSLRYPRGYPRVLGMERAPSPKRPRSSRERLIEVLSEHEAAVQLLGDAGGGIWSGRFVSTIAGRAGSLAVASPARQL
jgi:hypothetical protein